MIPQTTTAATTTRTVTPSIERAFREWDAAIDATEKLAGATEKQVDAAVERVSTAIVRLSRIAPITHRDFVVKTAVLIHAMKDEDVHHWSGPARTDVAIMARAIAEDIDNMPGELGAMLRRRTAIH